MPVTWKDAKDAVLAYEGVIAAVYPQTVDVLVYVPNSATFYTRKGVRHVDDPDAAFHERTEDGVWQPGQFLVKISEELHRLHVELNSTKAAVRAFSQVALELGDALDNLRAAQGLPPRAATIIDDAEPQPVPATTPKAAKKKPARKK